MGLLNLALGQLLGLMLPLAGLLVALYFYDRSRRSVLVSTLRFWPRLPAPPVRQRHKRIQHPLSLALQLAAVALLLLAIADPRGDADSGQSTRRVLVLDTSAAMALADAAGNSLMEQARDLALDYVSRLPPNDPVLLVEAHGSPMVRVPFTADKERVREAILGASPGRTALDLGAAFSLADGALRLAMNSGGAPVTSLEGRAETAYVGPGRFAGQPVRAGALPSVRFLETAAPEDSAGILSLRATADATDRGKWTVELEARNYRDAPGSARLEFLFNGTVLGYRDLDIRPAASASLQFTLRTKSPGRLLARLAERDAYPANNSASVLIPARRDASLQVFGASERDLLPLLADGAGIDAQFVQSRDELAADAIHVWASGGPAGQSRRGIYLAPPGGESPIPGTASAPGQRIVRWSPSHAVARGVRDPDLAPAAVRVFEPAEGDHVVASGPAGPVIIARETADERFVAFGFDLADESVRGHLAAPLLFANAVAWLDSAAFRAQSVEARPPGSVAVEAPTSALRQISVRGPRGVRVPWILDDGSVRFYAGSPGTYRIVTADRDVTLHLTQPAVPGETWPAPDSAARGLPPAFAGGGPNWPAWPWLAAVAGLILLADWRFFGRDVHAAQPAPARAAGAVQGDAT